MLLTFLQKVLYHVHITCFVSGVGGNSGVTGKKAPQEKFQAMFMLQKSDILDEKSTAVCDAKCRYVFRT